MSNKHDINIGERRKLSSAEAASGNQSEAVLFPIRKLVDLLFDKQTIFHARSKSISFEEILLEEFISQ